MEKDRFMDEYASGDEWTVLSMLQAITVYILLRIFDEGTFSAEFDLELTKAMMVNLRFPPLINKLTVFPARKLQSELINTDWSAPPKSKAGVQNGKIHLLFDIKPGQRAKSRVGLSVLPLPAHKQLWDAATEVLMAANSL
ncbi:hypothetical protein M7I_4480 [Glarea lozoyensis 74030]|uniref:Uncharacterized protein n=1 Tax=Glarea lozoyensis (strain ATCC 74030 / MF5533) TaxID=1104152 RepID=H0EPA9_GLAL7|nr:hypothetical protein M7I_4480 [Glarea lozoyensis 74030]